MDQHVAFQTTTATESSGTTDDWKVSFFFVFIDKLVAALDERFRQGEVLSWMAVFTPKKWKEEASEQNSVEIRNLCEKYGVPYATVTEYGLFSANEGRVSCNSFKDLPKYMFENDFHNLYPNIFQLAKLCATIPVTSSECERTHSKFARVKSAVRCSMTDYRLASLVDRCRVLVVKGVSSYSRHTMTTL